MTSKAPSKTTQVSEVKLPQWVEDASKENFQFAKDIADRPYEAYTGQRVSGPGALTTQGYDLLSKSMAEGGAGAASYGKATGALDSVMANPITAERVKADAVKAERVKAGMLTDLNRDAYMNPYIDNVETKALGALDRQRVQSLMGNAEKAKQASAFGGSRSAIVDAVTNSESINNAGILSAGLRKDAFDTASGLMMTDLDRKLTGDTSNADRALRGDISNADRKLSAATANQGANLDAQKNTAANRLAASQGYVGIGDSQQKSLAQNYGLLAAAGGQQSAQEQRELDAKYASWKEAQDEDINDLNLRLSALGMSPYGKSESTQKETQGGSSGTDFAQLGLGALTAILPFIMSDRRVKKDIKKVGSKKGIPIYDYRYKGEPSSMRKIRGPMAQDIEKKFPDAVHEIAGVKMVDKKLMGVLSA